MKPCIDCGNDRGRGNKRCAFCAWQILLVRKREAYKRRHAPERELRGYHCDHCHGRHWTVNCPVAWGLRS